MQDGGPPSGGPPLSRGASRRRCGLPLHMHALFLAATLPFMQAWSDTGLIPRDDDWSGVAGVVGHRGDGLTSAAGADPRTVVADGSGTPVDVNANERDPGAVGLAAGLAEFELPDPMVALQGSATAAAPHLVVSLDTRGRSGVSVRYRLRDIDPSSIANAVQAVALQYRVGGSGPFAAVPGGFVGDANTGPGAATLVTPVSAVLPAAAENQPLVQLRILTTNAVGQDEWVGVDDIEVEAGGVVCGPPGGPGQPPGGGPASPPGPPVPPPSRPVPPRPSGPPDLGPPTLRGLTISPASFKAAKQGPTLTRAGRAGAYIRFHLSRSAKVEFRVTSPHLPGLRPAPAQDGGTRAPHAHMGRTPLIPREIGRFSIRGRRGLNRFRLTGRLRGRALRAGSYRLTAQAIGDDNLVSPPASAGFRVR